MQRWWLAIGLLVAMSGCTRNQPGETPDQPGAGPAVGEASEPPPEEYQAAVATVYFADADVEYLEAEAPDVPSTGDDPAILAEGAMRALLAGPTEPAHVRVLPESLKLNSVTVADGLATVDVSKALLDDFQGGSGVASLAIYSIVDTVCAVDGVERVKIVVDGQPVEDFAGVISLTEPLPADMSLVGGKPL